jgi:hypothetical protein
VTLPRAAGIADGLGSAVFVRHSIRPSRRAVLHLDDLTDSFAPADLARWYNERGFHFYIADLDPRISIEPAARRQRRSPRSCFDELDIACAHLRQADGIDAIILSARASAALTAALWCDARRLANPVDALILSSPDFGRGLRTSLDIACPVLVITAADEAAGQQSRRARRSADTSRLGQHVTRLLLEVSTAEGEAAADRKRYFDEMGRWLGAYMYGQIRDQLL